MTVPRGAAFRRRPLWPAPSGEEGFTLLELILVVAVIVILLGIALPGFVAARQTAQDRATQADLRHALEAANTAYIDQQDFGTFDASTLSAVETELRFVNN